MMVHEDSPLIEFTADDRCDRCGAQAYHLARHEQYGELMFCRHHLPEKRFDEMVADGWEIVSDYAGLDRLLNPSQYISVE